MILALAIAALVLGVGLASIAHRLIIDQSVGALTTRTLLVGGFVLAGLLGLELAVLQTLVRGQ